jgi:HK97 gp10 family phage protein
MPVKVLGVPETVARFARAAAMGEVAKVEGQSNLAEEVAEIARSIVPVDTGNLQSSIEAHEDRVSTDVAYAPFVEYGTSMMASQPFMRPAADSASGDQAEHIMKLIMDRA